MPREFVVSVVATPVAVFFALTLAPIITALVESDTVPKIVPKDVCAAVTATSDMMIVKVNGKTQRDRCIRTSSLAGARNAEVDFLSNRI
jgi:hypothetical protein